MNGLQPGKRSGSSSRAAAKVQVTAKLGSLLLRRAFLSEWIAAASFLSLFLALSGTGRLSAQTNHDRLPDPLPVRRLHIPSGRLPLEIKQQAGGILEELSRLEFESKIQQAAKALQRPSLPPRLIKAEYTASLEGTSLVGKAVWTIDEPPSSSGVLLLSDLKLAVRKLQLDPEQILFGLLDGKSPGFLFRQFQAERKLEFDWSLGGNGTAGEMYFDFQAPPCASSKLELSLPRGHVLTPMQGIVVSKGRRDDAKGARLWTLHFPGRQSAQFKIYQIAGPHAAAPLQVVEASTKQTLTPNQLESEFSFNIEILHNVVNELVFDWDFPYPPTKVTCANVDLEDWRLTDLPISSTTGKKEKTTRQVLVLRLAEARRELLPTVKIYSQLPLPDKGPWTSPGVRLLNALVQQETLALHIHPDVNLQQWRPGSFQLVQAQKDESNFDVLNLLHSGGGKITRPSALLKTQSPHVSVQQATWWRIGANAAEVVADLTYRINRGKCRRLVLRLPNDWGKDWQLKTVELQPKGLSRRLALIQKGGQHFLIVELQRGLSAQEQIKASIRLNHTFPKKITRKGVTLSFPQLSPADGYAVRGLLGISIDPRLQALTMETNHSPSAAEQKGPWGTTPLSAFYNYRDTPVTGEVRLIPHPVRLTAACFSEVVLADEGAKLRLQLKLEPLAGSIDVIDLQVSAPMAGNWIGQTAADKKKISRIEELSTAETFLPLLALGSVHPAQSAALLAEASSGRRWRIRLAEPLTRHETLELEAPLQPISEAKAREGRLLLWNIPIATVSNAAQTKGHLAIHSPAMKIASHQATGLLAPANSSSQPPTKRTNEKRRFGYIYSSNQTTKPRLWLSTSQLAPDSSSPLPQCDFARLTTSVEPNGRLVHHFSFQWKDWKNRSLPLILPAQAKLHSVLVQGKWLDKVPQRVKDGALQLELPVNSQKKMLAFEVIYSTPSEPQQWYLWKPIAVDMPKLPVAPRFFTRRWRLPSGVVPLDQNAYLPASISTVTGNVKPLETLRDSWYVGENLFTDFQDPSPAKSWASRQAQMLLAAEQAFRGRYGKQELSLGFALKTLVVEFASPKLPIVIDTHAFHASKISPENAIPPSPEQSEAPFWQELGIVYYPCPAGALLTVVEEVPTGKDLQRDAETNKKDLYSAVERAAAYGYDASGRYQLLPVWLGQYAAGSRHQTDRLTNPLRTGWTVWKPAMGSFAPEVVYLVNRKNVSLLAVLASLVTALLLWQLSRWMSVVWRFRLMILWATAAGIALCWTPIPLRQGVWWISIAGFVVTAANLFFGRLLSAPKASQRGGRLNSAALLLFATLGSALLTAVAAGAGGGGDGTGYSVFILGSPNAAVAKQKVLAPPELLEKLDQIRKKDSIEVEDAILQSAEYHGEVKGEWVEFDVDYQVFCTSANAKLLLPLHGVQLLPKSTVAGKEVYPLRAPGSQNGYMIPLQGYKFQQIPVHLRFQVKIEKRNSLREISCHIPPLLRNKLSLDLPPSAHSPKVVAAVGQQKGRLENTGYHLDADLGQANKGQSLSSLTVRWYEPTGSKKKAKVEAEEYHLWDLQGQDARLVSVLKYHVSKGEKKTFQLVLPEELHLRSVEVKHAEDGTSTPTTVQLDRWKTYRAEKKRILELEMGAPVEGEIEITLMFVPILPLTKNSLSLPLPTPLGVLPMGGLLAYALDEGQVVDFPFQLSLTPIEANVFATEWQTLRMPPPAKLSHSYRFRRMTTTALAGLHVAFPPSMEEWEQEVWWDLYPTYAHVKATIHISDIESSKYFLWEIPPSLTIAKLSSPDLLRWSVLQTGKDRYLQIWLDAPEGLTSIRMEGWIAPPTNKGIFNIPRVQPLVAQTCPTQIHVKSSPGLKIQPHATTKLELTSKSDTLSYHTISSEYAGAISVAAMPVKPQVRILTQAEKQGEDVLLTSWVHFTIPIGTLSEATVVAKNWPGAEVNLEAVRTSNIKSIKVSSLVRRWKLQLVDGVTREYSLKLTGRVKSMRGKAFKMPQIEVPDTTVVERWLAVTDSQLVPKAEQRVKVIEDPRDDLRLWPPQAERIAQQGQLWKVEDEDWQLKLIDLSADGDSSIRIVGKEVTAVVAAGPRWLYQAEFTLAAPRDEVLHFQLPRDAKLLSVTLDGKKAEYSQGAERWFRLRIAETPTLRHLSLRWMFPPQMASFYRPELAAPLIKGNKTAATIYSVRVPLGYRLLSKVTDPAEVELLSRSGYFMSLADSCLKATSVLMEAREQAAKDLTENKLEELQNAFYWYCWQAEQFLGHDRRDSRELGLESEAEIERLRRLLTQNRALARRYDFEELRRQAQSQPNPRTQVADLARQLPVSGTPFHFSGSGRAGPIIRLDRTSGNSWFKSSVMTNILLAFFFVAVAISLVPGAIMLLRLLWPEHLLAAALAGVAFLGWSIVAVLLVAIAIFARVYWVFRKLWLWRQRRQAALSPDGAG